LSGKLNIVSGAEAVDRQSRPTAPSPMGGVAGGMRGTSVETLDGGYGRRGVCDVGPPEVRGRDGTAVGVVGYGGVGGCSSKTRSSK